MSRNRNKSRRAQGPIPGPAADSQTTRPSARPRALDHTADASDFYHSTPPLMRTVLGDRLPGTRSSPVVRSRATGRSRLVSPWEQVRLISPELSQRATLCARRSIRREVIFATKSTGKGSKAKRTITRNSKVRC